MAEQTAKTRRRKKAQDGGGLEVVRELNERELAFARKRWLELTVGLAEAEEARKKAERLAVVWSETIALLTGDPELGIDPRTMKVVRRA